MVVIGLALAATVCGALGTFLTKSITLRLPMWQAVGPLFALNALLVVPLIPFGPTWKLLEPEVLTLHVASVILLCASAACIFTLVDRGRPSGAAVGQALSPTATLLAAPLLLGTELAPLTVLAVLTLVSGALIPLRGSFEGVSSLSAVALLITLGGATGLLTVLTAMLAQRGVGLPETYVVRTAAAASVYAAIAWPRAVSLRDVPALAVRSSLVTASFLLTILAVQIGNVVVIQSILGSLPLMVIGIEWLRHRHRPDPTIVIGSVVASIGLAVLLAVTR